MTNLLTKSLKNGWFLVFLAGLIAGILPFYRPLFFPDRVLLFRDLSLWAIPGKFIWFQEMLRTHSIPLWNYAVGGGMPYYGDVSIGPLFPLNFIFLFFSQEHFLYGFTIYVVAHYALLYWSGFFLLRVLRLPFYLALILALPFAWGGSSMGFMTGIMAVGSLIGVLSFLATWILFLRTHKFLFLALASFFLALPIYAGEPQNTYILALVAFASLFLKINQGGEIVSLQKKIASLVLLFSLALLCACAQILPAIELAQNSTRGFSNLSVEENLVWSLHPLRFLDFFLPFFTGNIFPIGEVWSKLDFYIFSFYIGTTSSFGLLAWTVAKILARKFLCKKNAIILLLLLFVALLALGKNSPFPLYAYFVKYLPFWRTFRYPERLGYFLSLILLLLSAKAWHKLIRLLQMLPARAYIILHTTIIIFCAMIAVVYFCFQNEAVPASSYFHPLLIAVILYGLLLTWSYDLLQKKYFICLFLLVSSTDLFLVAKNLVWDSPIGITQPETYPLAKAMKDDLLRRHDEIQKGGSRRFTSVDLYLRSPDYSKTAPILDMPSQIALAYWDNLAPNTSTYWGIEDVTAYHNLVPKAKVELINEFHGNHDLLLKILGVYYKALRRNSAPRELDKDSYALPYIFLPQAIDFIHDRKMALRFMQSRNFRYQKEIVVNDESANGGEDARRMLRYEESTGIDLNISARNGSRLALKVSSATDRGESVLVWNENFNKHWRAQFHNVTLPIFQANLWAMAVTLPALKAGETNELEFVYSDPMIVIGKILSFIWLLVVSFGIYMYSYKKGADYR